MYLPLSFLVFQVAISEHIPHQILYAVVGCFEKHNEPLGSTEGKELSCVAQLILDSQEGLCSMESAGYMYN
jgi:hypothetical protein